MNNMKKNLKLLYLWCEPNKIIFSHCQKPITNNSVYLQGHNSCTDQPCSLLCLPQPGQRHSCFCPDGAPIITLPNGDLQCKCPSGYQLQNDTCVKTSEEQERTLSRTHKQAHTITNSIEKC